MNTLTFTCQWYVHDLLSSAVQQKGTVHAGINAIAMCKELQVNILLETCHTVQRFFAQQETGGALL
jgi:hypothetical protein